MSTPIAVNIWSDIACPWCFIGKRKFEAGLAAFDGADDVEITYHSFELAPDTPVDFEGSEADFLASHKGMDVTQVEQMLRQVTAVAADVGLDYDFDSVQHTKTLLAHQALHYAKAHGRQLDLVERLFAAYFEQGRHVGRADELADLGADVGLDREEMLAALEAGTYTGAVDADIAQARAYGIQGVPFFVVDGRYGISGAQKPEVFTQALEQVRSERAGTPA
ncbi:MULTISPECIES: DsbA family oxidoreductase [unclassified Pseudactinotalea]|uniref:DsbA family oxidoreductase n=1 Tax=unclassified Pseudactinotalea TaxID=2649176 RepID=UPI003C7B4621